MTGLSNLPPPKMKEVREMIGLTKPIL
jgi:hypothetical protein